MVDVFAKDFDLVAALRTDDGAKSVCEALDQGLKKVRTAVDKGLSPAEFKVADSILKAFQAARDAMEVLPTFVRR